MIIPSVTASALFCEDIREELSGALTLVGVFPDNLALPSTPIMMAKFAVFVRLALNVQDAPEARNLIVKLQDPSGNAVIAHEITADVVKQTIVDATAQGSRIATFFTRLTSAPFPVPEFGRFEAVVESGENTFLAGAIRFVPATAESLPT